MSPEYLISAVAWSVAGFLLGYYVAVMTFDLRRIKEAVVPEPERHHAPPLRPNVPNRLLGVVMVLLAVITVAAVAVNNQRRSEVIECQSRINADLVNAINHRAEIADDDRAALDSLILSIVRAQQFSEEKRRERGQQAIADYVGTIKASRKERADVYLPTRRDYYECGD